MQRTTSEQVRIETVVRLGGDVEEILATTSLSLTDSQMSLLEHVSNLLDRIRLSTELEADSLLQAQGIHPSDFEEAVDHLEIQERARDLDQLRYDWPPTEASRLIEDWILENANRFVATERPVPFTSGEIAEWAIEKGWANNRDMSKEDVTRAVGNTLREIPMVRNLGNRKPARWALMFPWTEAPEEERR